MEAVCSWNPCVYKISHAYHCRRSTCHTGGAGVFEVNLRPVGASSEEPLDWRSTACAAIPPLRAADLERSAADGNVRCARMQRVQRSRRCSSCVSTTNRGDCCAAGPDRLVGLLHGRRTARCLRCGALHRGGAPASLGPQRLPLPHCPACTPIRRPEPRPRPVQT